MKVKASLLVGCILKILDESEEILDDHVKFGTGSLDVRTLVREVLPCAATEVAKSADIDEIDDFIEFRPQPSWSGGTAKVPLPTDCLRLLFIRMSYHDFPCTDITGISSPAIRLRRMWLQRASARFDGPGTPAIAIGFADGSRNAEVFGSTPGSTVAAAGYLRIPEIDSNDEIEISRSLIGPTVDLAASRIRKILDYDNH